MTEYQITKATANRETDVLSVEALALDTRRTVTAQGWLSATLNYYPPEAYAEDGHRLPDARARAMGNEEKKAYILGLISAADVQATVEDAPAEPVAEEDMTDLFS